MENLNTDSETIIEENIIIYDYTFIHMITNFSFGNLPESSVIDILIDGRSF